MFLIDGLGESAFFFKNWHHEKKKIIHLLNNFWDSVWPAVDERVDVSHAFPVDNDEEEAQEILSMTEVSTDNGVFGNWDTGGIIIDCPAKGSVSVNVSKD